MTPSPLKVLLIQNSADIYGGSKCLMRLAAQLNGRGHRVIVLLPEDGPLVQWLKSRGIQHTIQTGLCSITRKNFAGWRKLVFLARVPVSALEIARLIRRENVDIVHSNVGTIVSSGLGAWFGGVPHVWHIRDWYQEFKQLWVVYSRYILAFSSKVLPSSIPIAEQFPASPKIQVLHDGLDPAEFAVDRAKLRAEFRARFGLGDQVVIGCVGRIKYVRKGQEFLVQAAKILADSGREFRLVLVGAAHPDNADHEVRLRALVTDLGLDPLTTFTGEVSDPLPAYSAMDIFVLPSAQPEPFGGVNMEAMGMGLPIVATRLGGSIEQLEENVTGFLVEPANPEDLAAKLAVLLDDPARREAMGAAGEARLRSKFSIETMTDKIETLYHQALARSDQ